MLYQSTSMEHVSAMFKPLTKEEEILIRNSLRDAPNFLRGRVWYQMEEYQRLIQIEKEFRALKHRKASQIALELAETLANYEDTY